MEYKIMQEKSWLTTVIGIGKEGHRLMHEVQSHMVCENFSTKYNG